jgi:hypothetical protein
VSKPANGTGAAAGAPGVANAGSILASADPIFGTGATSGSSVLLGKTFGAATNNKGGNNQQHVTGSNNFNALLGNSPSAILNNGLNPLAPAVGAMGNSMLNISQGNGAQMHGQQAQQGQQGGMQQQPAYFVQQAVYLDHNGQPMFYRPGMFCLLLPVFGIFY